MRKILVIVAAPLILAVLVTACSREDGGALSGHPVAPPGVVDKSLSLAEHLAAAWLAGESYAYDTVSGTVPVPAGGTFTAHPASYPEGFVVSVSVPPGAVPTEWAENGNFTVTVQVPRWDTEFGAADDPCPVILEPDGVQFLAPVSIWLVLPQSLARRCEGGYLFYNLERLATNGVESYLYRDASRAHSVHGVPAAAPPPGVDLEEVADGCGNLIRCNVLHFSRWEMESEECDQPNCG